MTRWFSYLVLFWGVFLILVSGCEKGEDSPDPITDIDGNIYETAKIGNQVWMVDNLRTTRYNDGTDIKMITKSHEWYNAVVPAFSWYNNDSAMFRVPYGGLYNGYVAVDDKICPEGWHIPDLEEWRELVVYLGDTLIAGGKLKEEGLSQWYPPNKGADNSSRFTGLPAGIRYFEGTFSSLSYFTAFWSANESDTASMHYMSLSYLDSKATFGIKSRNHGFSIRCIRN